MSRVTTAASLRCQTDNCVFRHGESQDARGPQMILSIKVKTERKNKVLLRKAHTIHICGIVLAHNARTVYATTKA